MTKSKRKLFLELFSFFSCVIVIILSASALEGSQSTVQILGLIVGSFGAGAALTNAVKNYRLRRESDEQSKP